MWAGRIRPPTAGTCSTGLKSATSGEDCPAAAELCCAREMGTSQYIMGLWADARTPVPPMYRAPDTFSQRETEAGATTPALIS